MNFKKWLVHEFSTGGETGQDYKLFQKEYKAHLTKQARLHNYVLTQFNGNHYCFSAVMQSVRTKVFYYVSISDVRFFSNQWYSKVLWREMRHATDWTGLMNQYAPVEKLLEAILSYDEKKPNANA